METIPTPPEYVPFIEPVFPEQNGDDFTPEALDRWSDRLHQAEKDFEPISQRLDALNDAIEDGWCPSRVIKNEMDHLSNVLTAYHLGKYPNETRQTLDDAEAELATWQTLSEAAREVIIEADERAEADLAARRRAMDEISQRKAALYKAIEHKKLHLAPAWQTTLDNLTNPYLHKDVVAEARKTLDTMEAHTAAQREPLRVITAASFAGRAAPEREELVRGLIPAKIIGGLYGDGAVGKSLLAMMLGVSVASGALWLNRFVQKGPVVYVCCEDDEDEVHRRLENICREMRVNMASLGDFHILSLADEESVLAAADGRSSVLTATPLFNQLVELTGDVKPRLLIGDTLNDIFAGSEIDRMQAKQFVKLMRKLVIPHGGTGLILAHPSVDGMRSGSGTSGSTGWNNSFRWRGYLDKVLDESGREIDITRRVLKTKKLNYGPQGGEIELQYHNGCYRTAEAGPMIDPLHKERRADRVFVDLLRKAIAQNNHVSAATNSGLYAPKAFRIDADKQGVKYAELKDAMGRLLDTGKIENAPYGARSRNQFRLYVAPEK